MTDYKHKRVEDLSSPDQVVYKEFMLLLVAHFLLTETTSNDLTMIHGAEAFGVNKGELYAMTEAITRVADSDTIMYILTRKMLQTILTFYRTNPLTYQSLLSREWLDGVTP